MPLLPARVRGPLSPLTTSVAVEHLLPGASAEILVNGAPIQRQNTATSNSVAVSLAGSTLPPGGAVTSVWSLGGETSPPSLPELVLPYPTSLPAPVFLSPVHTAVDWIAVGGLYPGALVELRNGGTVVGGPDTSDAGTVHVRIHGTIGSGDVLTAIQTVPVPNVGTVKSSPAESLPAEEWFPREEQPGVPVVVGPIRECDGAVLVGGAVPGCHVHLHTGGVELEYAAVAVNFWAVLPGAAHAPATFAAANHLHRRGRKSGLSAAIGIDPSAPLRPPALAPDTQYCPLAVSVTAQNLAPKAAVTLELRGAATTTVLGRGGAPDTGGSDVYWLGDLSALVPATPPYPAVVLKEQLCVLAAESNRAGVHRPQGQQEVPPGFFRPPVECARWLNVQNVRGCVVTVRSNAPDWPVLAYWALVPESDWLSLNRPLRLNEQLTVTVEAGCVPAHLRTSDPVTVAGVGDIDALRVEEPVRPGANRSVWIRDAIPGSRVHVFVDDKWRTSVWSIGSPTVTSFAVHVGVLTEESVVTASQTLCGKNGDATPPVRVTRGRMDLEASPQSVTRGQTVSMTIHARDADFGFPMTGMAIKGPTGHVGYVGQPFTVSAAAATASPIRFTVDLEGYAQGVVDVPILAPAPPPQATFTITSIAALGVSNQVIKDIEWTLTGGGQTIRGTQTPNTTTCVVSIPLPAPAAGSTVVYSLSGKATVEFIQPGTGTKLTQQATVFYTYAGLQGLIVAEWRGTPRTAEINISWAPIYDLETGEQIDTVYCFVLNKMS